jgi:glycosyltransferase involved in cell wall biosynthesis
MVNSDLNRGGAARMAATLTRALNRHVEDVRARMLHCGNTHKDSVFIGLKRPGSRPLNAFLARLAGSTAVFDMGVAREILQIAADDDLLHLHNLHGYYLNYRKLLLAWRHRPVVWTWHDMWGATGRCGQSVDCERWKVSCGHCPHKSFYPTAWIDVSDHEHRLKSRLLLSHPNLTIVAPSPWMAEIAIDRGFSAGRIHVIPNSVDIEVFTLHDKRDARRRIGIDENAFTALFIASNCDDPQKGYADFVSAAGKAGINAIAVGRMPPAPASFVRHPGRIHEPKKLVEYYAAADCMVITSYADTYPTTVIEAIACGTPVYGYAVGGIPFQVPAPDACLVACGDIPALTAKLKAFAATGGKTEEMSNSLRTYAAERWSEFRVARDYARLYHHILQTSPPE